MERIGHSHPSATPWVAPRAQVKRLILVHHSSFEVLDYGVDLERARQIFPSFEVAYDGMEIDF